jgi:hypothetical protein
MALDPNDPLIPMPWQMDSIRAYRASKAMQAEEDALRMQQLRLSVEKANEETTIGRTSKAADIAAFLEQEKQKESGIPIGEEMSARMTAKGGPSILEATKMQGQLDVEAKMRQAKVEAAKNILAGEKSLLPTADINLGGVKRTVLAPEAGRTSADIYGQIYRNQVPQVASTYEAEGYDRDSAIRMASQDVRKELVKASTGGKVVLTGADGLSTISYSNEQAERMWRDPKTPKGIKVQLNNFFGESEEPTASSYIKSKTGR